MYKDDCQQIVICKFNYPNYSLKLKINQSWILVIDILINA